MRSAHTHKVTQAGLPAPHSGRFDCLAEPGAPTRSPLEQRIVNGTYAADAHALALAFLDYLEQRTAD